MTAGTVKLAGKQPMLATLAKRLDFILVVLFLIFSFLAYTSYASAVEQKRQQAELATAIMEAQRALATLPKPAGDLDKQLVAARARLAAAESLLPPDIDGTLVIDTILRLASNSSTTAVPLGTTPWRDVKVQQHTFRTMGLNVSASGDMSNIVKLIRSLEGTEFATLTIDELSITRAKPKDIPEGVGGVPVTAVLNLSLYARAASR
jgi:hypothetical protein